MDKTFKGYEGCYHELFNEPNHLEIFADVVYFLERRLVAEQVRPIHLIDFVVVCAHARAYVCVFCFGCFQLTPLINIIILAGGRSDW